MLCYCYSVESELSGVYCGICILLRQLEVEGCADLVTTAQKLRQKRPAIITNKVGISLSGLHTLKLWFQIHISYSTCTISHSRDNI